MKFIKFYRKSRELYIGRLYIHTSLTRYFGLGFRWWHRNNAEVLLFKVELYFEWLTPADIEEDEEDRIAEEDLEDSCS